jgi:hypothetical protein
MDGDKRAYAGFLPDFSLLNSASGISCDVKCGGASPSISFSCESIGTDADGSADDNNVLINRSGGCWSQQSSSGCGDVMIDNTIFCGGYRTRWTNCRCSRWP